MKQLIKAYNLFFIFMCIIWDPFQIYILKVDGAGRSIVIMSITALLLNVFEFWKQKKLFTSSYFLCWIILLCYSMYNAFSKGFYAEFGTFKFLRDKFFDSFFLLIFMMLELKKDKRTCLWVIWLALGSYLLLGLPSFSLNIEGRFNVEGIGNLYPLHAVCFLFVSCILYVEEKIKFGFLIVIALGIGVIIFLSGTRKAFGAEAILLLGAILNNGKKRSLGAWLRIIFLGLVLIGGVYYMVNYTAIGERILRGTDKRLYVYLVDNQKLNDLIMLFLGDRAIQYESAIELFHENFWTGIGLTNFIYLDTTGRQLVLHSEYMVQLCENGIIGFTLLMIFYVLLIRSLIRNRKYMKNQIGMALFGLGTILFINFTSWTYCMKYIMVFYAILFVYAYSDDTPKKKNHLQIQREQWQETLDSVFGPVPDKI